MLADWAARPGTVWLDGRRRGWRRLFVDPVDVVTSGDWRAAVRAWTRAGDFVAGVVSYEEAAGLERDPRLPAVWLGRYREPHRGRLLVGFDGGEAEPRPSLTWTEDRWRDAVASVRERIANGDCYQVNLARPVSWSGSVDPWRAALRLRRVTDAARGAFLRLSPELAVLSASPERLLDVVGDLVVSVPIKGTRPFGDPGARDELLGSAKDRAELAMIVDLVRHDLSAACAVGSVRSRARRVARHATVWHAHQPVRGCIAPGCEPWEVLERLLPAGSVTGAPKRRVIQRIAELEGAPRGFSYGAIGWMSAHEGQWSVAIRTAVIRPNDGWFHVGGGITWASEAEDEWRETIAKSRALARALLGVEVA